MSYSSASHVRVGGMLLAVTVGVVTAIWFTRSDSKPAIKHRPITCPSVEPMVSLPAVGTPDRFYALDELSKRALEAGRVDEADALAVELLELAPQHPGDWNYGNAIHHGNLVRGRVALARGGKQPTLRVRDIAASPQLDSFGPNTALAHELLERGETGVVLQYLQLCKRFWEEDFGAVRAWTGDVVAGRFPEFRANNCY
jgi:hypothetical protein